MTTVNTCDECRRHARLWSLLFYSGTFGANSFRPKLFFGAFSASKKSAPLGAGGRGGKGQAQGEQDLFCKVPIWNLQLDMLR